MKTEEHYFFNEKTADRVFGLVLISALVAISLFFVFFFARLLIKGLTGPTPLEAFYSENQSRCWRRDGKDFKDRETQEVLCYRKDDLLFRVKFTPRPK